MRAWHLFPGLLNHPWLPLRDALRFWGDLETQVISRPGASSKWGTWHLAALHFPTIAPLKDGPGAIWHSLWKHSKSGGFDIETGEEEIQGIGRMGSISENRCLEKQMEMDDGGPGTSRQTPPTDP